MAEYISMPKLGMNMTSGIIVGWLVKEGSQVEAGQPVLEVETDKAVNTIESPMSGLLAKIIKHEGEDVPCTFVLAVITKPGEEIPSQIPETITDGIRPTAEVEVKPLHSNIPEASEIGKTTHRRVFISPSAKLLAQELGIDLIKIKPTGDRISRKDVEAAYQALQTAGPIEQKENASATGGEDTRGKPTATIKEASVLRRRIAEHMAASARTVARVGLKLEADAAGLMNWRERVRSSGLMIGYSELLAKITATALKEFHYMNAQMVGNEIWEMSEINVGIAVDVEGGLVVPVIKNVDQKTLEEIQHAISEMINRARAGRSLPEDLRGGTFTITNLGNFEIEEFLPIINLPECAILGVGAIIRKPVAIGEMVEIRPRIGLTLAFDHRLVDGVPAARFLQRLKGLVENPPID